MKEDLDKQVRAAAEVRQKEKDLVKLTGARIQSDVDRFEQEQKERSMMQRDQKINHQSEVSKQIDERKTLQKILVS
jgi:hypothetical protein